MQMTQPNQQFGVQVPQFPKLKEFDAELETLSKAIRETEKQIAELERELRLNNQRAGSISDFNAINEAAAKRLQLSQQIQQLESAKKTSELQIAQVNQQRDEWLHFFADLIVRKQKLVRELSEALPDDQTPPDLIIGGTPKRTRDAVATELLEVFVRLANFSGDEKLRAEALQMKKEMAARRPYVVLENNYVRLRSGEFVTEAKFQELGIELGDVVSKGATSGPYRRGSRVDRAEAASLGLA